MIALLAQDWVTVRNSTLTTPTTQSEPAWLDVSPYQDLVAWLEVKEFSTASGSLFIGYQTAPTKDDVLFQAMNDTTIPVTAGVTTTVLLKETAKCPLSHWFRWQLFPTGGVSTWDITFRLWLTVSRPGRAVQNAIRQPSTGGASALSPQTAQPSRPTIAASR